MFCINCGKKVSPNAKYCPECGSGVSVSAESKNQSKWWQQPLWQQPLKYRMISFSIGVILVVFGLCVIAADETITEQSKYLLLGSLIALTIFCTFIVLISRAINKIHNRKTKIISLIISIIVLALIFFGGLAWWGSTLTE